MGEFITPPSLPPTTYCRRLLIPNSPEWIGTVTGALMSLIYASEWKQTTGITTDEAADRAREMFNLYLDSGNDGECGDMACCEDKPTLKRVDPDTGQMQISTDGGATWTADPNAPSFSVVKQPPPIPAGTVDNKCDAATNAQQHIIDVINETSSNIATAGSVYEFAVIVATAILTAAIVLITGGGASPIALTIAGLIWGAGTAVFEAGQAAFDAYWSSDNLDIVLCALLDNISEAGDFSEDEFNAFMTQIKFELPSSPARDMVTTAIRAVGAAGLSNMASYGGASDADCSDCGEDEGCADNYTVFYGNEISRTATTITVEGLYNIPDGRYHWQIGLVPEGSTPPTTGCCYIRWESSALDGYANWRCSEASPSTDPWDHASWYLDYTGSAGGNKTFTISGDPLPPP